MRQIRAGVFETNSSSVHSLTMCNADEYEAWKEGKKVYDEDSEEFLDITPEIQEEMEMYKREKYGVWDMKYLTYNDYWERHKNSDESFEYEHTTKSGEKVIAFGYYGYDC